MTDLRGTDGPQRFLEATTHTVAWFWKRLRDDELVLQPPFQRNPVWQRSQKAYLIDTILRGYPVPELYLQTTVTPRGEEQHIVVDGQQRVRACLEFIDNEYALGDESEDLAGLTFDQLQSAERQRIFEYKFVVRLLPDLPKEEIRGIFGRLNRNNVALNRQELRHATYWGEFITCMTDLSQEPFWVNSGIFTANDFRRMADIEYVSELAVAVLFGPQNKKSTIDQYYAAFELEFPESARVRSVFGKVLSELQALLSWPTRQRWSGKVDFYSLFLVLADRVDEFPFDREERDKTAKLLGEFSSSVSKLLSMSDDARESAPESRAALLYARGVRNSSDLGSRRQRISSLRAFLLGIEPQVISEVSGSSGALAKLALLEELMAPEDPAEDADE